MASDILIVDDEADICELVAGILQDEGHGTRTARELKTVELAALQPNVEENEIGPASNDAR
jgi:two-component system nitrogen regulation response regulator NtrX